MNTEGKEAWISYKEIVEHFLGNSKSPKFENIVENLMRACKNLGCNMSLKMHLLHSHLSFFPSNLGELNDEHGGRFHLKIQNAEIDIKESGTQELDYANVCSSKPWSFPRL